MAEAVTGSDRREADRTFFVGLARAYGGAVFFALPLLMTMEMWWFGFYLSRFHLTLFMLVIVPVLIVLDHFSGFEETDSWAEDVVDGLVAFGVGLTASAFLLWLFGVVGPGMELREIVGKIAVESVPASFGAVLANSQLAGDSDDGPGERKKRRRERAGYGGQVFFMAVGALFLAFNVAPTEEMVLIAYKMSMGKALALAAVSLLMMHAFVYAVQFRGMPDAPPGTPGWSLFLRFTVVGYAVALAISAYVLWTFGRFEDHAFGMYAIMVVVLGFPAALGAAAARLIL